MWNDINERIKAIIALKNQGKDPNQLIQMIIQRNPQAKLAMQRLNNMSQGKSPREFLMQLARQNGVNEQNIQALSQMFGK